ncbi:pseudouridine synthase [Sphingomonas sp. CJ20]
MIADGRIALNGVPLDTPATVLTSLDGVTVDGLPVEAPTAARLFRYHKPAGVLTAERDFTGRPTIYDRMPEGLPRVMPVGRLDLNTEGLLLLTTDGELKRALELPASGVERTYRARAYGQVSQEQLEDLMLGIEIDGVRYGSINANIERRTGANLWIEMTLTEGKNREVRRVLEHLGLQVSRLIRTRYGPFYLSDLPPGDVDEIRQSDLATFRTVLSKPGGGKAASNLQFAVRARVVEQRPRPEPVEAPRGARPGAVEPDRPRSRATAPVAARPRLPRAEPVEPEAPRRGRPAPAEQPPRPTGFGGRARARHAMRQAQAKAEAETPRSAQAVRPERAPQDAGRRERAPQFTPRTTPGAKRGPDRRAQGDVANPARAARARAHRDSQEPRAGDLVDRPRPPRPTGGKPRSGGPSGGRGKANGPSRPPKSRK